MLVTTRDVFTIPYFNSRRGFCRDGMRRWFDQHDLDWRDFVQHGIASEKLIEIGDAFALATVKWAHECAAREARDGR